MNRRTKETQSNAGINSALQGGGRPKVKSFGQKSWMLPQPVLIIGTYDKNGKPNAMNAAWGGQWDAKEIMIVHPVPHPGHATQHQYQQNQCSPCHSEPPFLK